MKLKQKMVLTIKLFQYPMRLNVIFLKKIENDYTGLTICENNSNIISLYICTRSKNAFLINSTIIHELVHVKQYVEQYTQTTMDRESEAYFIEELYDRITLKYFGKTKCIY